MTRISTKSVPLFCAFRETIAASSFYIPSARISRTGVFDAALRKR